MSDTRAAFVTTPHFGWYLPTYNDDVDQWGNHLNANISDLDTRLFNVSGTAAAALPSAGGTMTGPLILAGPPTANLQAATKAYVDSEVGNYLPLAGGALTGPLTLAGPPTANLQAATKAYADAGDDTRLPLAGGTLTGPLTLAADPAQPLQPSSKQYTDAADTRLAAQMANCVGRNLIHNSMFRVQQRGAGPWTTSSTYTADRWFINNGGGGTRSSSISAITDAGRTAIGDEDANYTLQTQFTGGSAAGDFDLVSQRIENVRRLANKTVTVSFWALSTTSTKLGVNMTQLFGTGGSPSPQVIVLATGAVVQLTTSWARYSVTIPVPSVAGKTFGTTAGTDFSQITFYYSSGANLNATAGNIGVQSGIVNLWGIQLEIGSVATPLEKVDPGDDLRRCQRFYQYHTGLLAWGYGPNTGPLACGNFIYPTTMRAAPTFTPDSQTYVNSSTLAANISPSPSNVRTQLTVTTVGIVNCAFNMALSADL